MARHGVRSDTDLLTEASSYLAHILRHVGFEDELRGYGEPDTAEYVLGCARALSRHAHYERPIDPGPATVEIR